MFQICHHYHNENERIKLRHKFDFYLHSQQGGECGAEPDQDPQACPPPLSQHGGEHWQDIQL